MKVKRHIRDIHLVTETTYLIFHTMEVVENLAVEIAAMGEIQ